MNKSTNGSLCDLHKPSQKSVIVVANVFLFFLCVSLVDGHSSTPPHCVENVILLIKIEREVLQVCVMVYHWTRLKWECAKEYIHSSNGNK